MSTGAPILRHTQTTDSNCWQTAVSCVLKVPIDALPPQTEIERVPNKVLDGYGSYENVLNGYLMKHHRLRYVTIREHAFTSVMPVRALHILCGPTIRTEQRRLEGRPGMHHAVVGKFGRMVWDVHPTGVGLLKVTSRGLFGKISVPDLLEIVRGSTEPDWNGKTYAGKRLVYHCLCPECGLEELRERAAAYKLIPPPPLRPLDLLP